MFLNDQHSKLNPCDVLTVLYPKTIDELISMVEEIQQKQGKISLSGQLHSMGGQPYGANSYNISNKHLNRIISFDDKQGTVTLEPGITWKKLIPELIELQRDKEDQWGIIQKQTGADDFSIAGCVSSNIHGRSLLNSPFSHDIISFKLLLADGGLKKCSQDENTELFRLVMGGFGLFGLLTEVTIQLQKRVIVERQVDIIELKDISAHIGHALKEGFCYGDCQFAIDPTSDEFINKAIFSRYRPVQDGKITEDNKTLLPDNWDQLVLLAHLDKAKAWQLYRDFYLSTSGQKYWSDTHQLSVYIEDYHERLSISEKRGISEKSSDMILEVYFPESAAEAFFTKVRQDFIQHNVNLFYGTIRRIKQDKHAFLKWAKKDYLCMVVNLNVIHSETGIAKSQEDFRRLIDIAIEFGGSYFLTYHTWARKDQVLHCYPELPEFLRKKKEYDPCELWVSDWYLHNKMLVGESDDH